MLNFEAIIGIEVHAVINSKTKMFSPALNKHLEKPNTLINHIDLGFPGVMPSINEAVVKKALHLGKYLNMELHGEFIQFDRKNYFYSDLPKGFQITQQYYPIGTNGYIEINVNNNSKKIRVERIHMEEDTAKQINENGEIYLDYNRCGSPLIEIVSSPDIKNADEACAYLNKLRQILKFGNISDAKLQDGSMRADINISLRLIGQKEFGTKVEIKNLNSINNVYKAINYEIKRQTELLLTNKEVIQETRRFDESSQTTIHMRDKSNAIDYHYITEPNLLTVCLSQKQIKDYFECINKSIDDIKNEFLNFGFNHDQIEILLNDYEMYLVFNYINQKINDPILVYKYLLGDIIFYLNKNNLSWLEWNNHFSVNIIDLLTKIKNDEINGKQAKTLIEHTFTSNKSINELITELNFVQITDRDLIKNIFIEILESEKDWKNKWDGRFDRFEKMIVGKLMAKTNGQANPKIANEILKTILYE